MVNDAIDQSLLELRLSIEGLILLETWYHQIANRNAKRARSLHAEDPGRGSRLPSNTGCAPQPNKLESKLYTEFASA